MLQRYEFDVISVTQDAGFIYKELIADLDESDNVS